MFRPHGTAEGDGRQNRGWRRSAQFRVWTCPQRVVDGRKGEAKRDESRDGEDLCLIEAGVPQALDVPDLNGVWVGCNGSSPVGECPFTGIQIVVCAAE